MNTPVAPDPELVRYSAFISYRHVEPDRQWAKWLHAGLETFRTPKLLVQNGIPPRIPRIFRDEDELPATADLKSEIITALQASRFLIVICSTRTQESRWVNAEIEAFRMMGRHDRILAVLIDGDPAVSFPRALYEIRASIANPDGSQVERIEEVEPLAADVRKRESESHATLRRHALLRMAACLLGCKFDDLRRRDAERRTRTLRALAGLFGAIAIALTTTTVVAVRQMSRAGRAEAVATMEAYVANLSAADARLGTLETTSALARLAACPSTLRNWEWRFLRKQADRASVVVSSEHADIILAMPHADPNLFITADAKGSVATRSVNSGDAIRSFSLGDGIRGIKYDRIGDSIVALTDDNLMHAWDAAEGVKIASLGDAGDLIHAQYSLDRARLLTLTMSSDFSGFVLIIHNLRGENPIAFPIESAGMIHDVALSPDGHFVAVTAFGETSVVEVETGETRSNAYSRHLGASEYFYGLTRFDPAGTLLVSSAPDGQLFVSEPESGEVLWSATVHTGEIVAVEFDHVGKRIVSASKDGTARIMDARTGASLLVLTGHEEPLTSAHFSPDDLSIVTASEDGTARLWSATSGQLLKLLRGHLARVGSAEFSADGALIVTAADDGTARIWETDSDEVVIEGAAKARFVEDRVWITGYQSVHSWDPEQQGVTTLMNGLVGVEQEITISRTGRWVATDWSTRRSESGVSFVPGVIGEQPPDEIPAATATPQVSDQSDDEPNRTDEVDLLVGDGPPVILVWRPGATYPDLALRAQNTGQITCADISNDDRLLAAGSRDSNARVWDLATGSHSLTLPHGEVVRDIAFSPSDLRLLTAGEDDVVKIWDVRTGAMLSPQIRHNGLLAANFDCSGDRILTCSLDGSANVWDSNRGTLLASLTGHEDAVLDGCFNPDGSRVATASADGAVILWDSMSGRELLRIRTDAMAAESVCFSPDGGQLAVVLDGRRVLICDGRF